MLLGIDNTLAGHTLHLSPILNKSGPIDYNMIKTSFSNVYHEAAKRRIKILNIVQLQMEEKQLQKDYKIEQMAPCAHRSGKTK